MLIGECFELLRFANTKGEADKKRSLLTIRRRKIDDQKDIYYSETFSAASQSPHLESLGIRYRSATNVRPY